MVLNFSSAKVLTCYDHILGGSQMITWFLTQFSQWETVDTIRVIFFTFKLNMKQPFENENTYDEFMNEWFMNKVRMEYEPLQELEKKCKLVQTEGSRNPKNYEKEMKENLKKLYAQRLFWKSNNKNALCWAFYYDNITKKLA